MAGYIRQSTFADGDTITATLFNNEYNQLLNVFSNTGGHKHDGTAAEGPVIGLIGDAGVVTPLNKVLIDSTNDHIEFWIDVSSSSVQQLYIADGAIVPVTDSDVDLGTTGLRFKDAYIDTVTTTGNVAVGGNLTVTGTTTFNGGTITMGDAATDNVVFGADVDSNIIPDDDDSYDLGSSSQEWRNLYIDGTANIDSLVADTADINGGTIDGAIIGGSSAAAITGTAITGTSFVIGSATITEAELEILDGATVTTDELNILDGVTSTAAEINILDGVTSTAAELNLLDGVTSTTAELNILDGVTASAADINLIDGITNGTVIASKAIITDANKDITGGRNITISGELDAGSLDVSGNVDVDGTLETDALSINGTAVTSTAAELNILDGVTATATELNLIDGVTATTAELNILDGVTATAAEINLLDGKAFLDEDNMASNSATGIASQQSIKAYVDTTVAATNEVVEDTTPQLGGDLDLNSSDITGTGNINITGTIQSSGNITGTLATAAQPNITSLGTLTGLTTTGDINFGDNDKAIFGAGSDLQIYHDGSNSWIYDGGTGNLNIEGRNIFIIGANNDTNLAGFIDGAEVRLYHNGNKKLDTTATGIDVTGTATMDGLTVDGNILLNVEGNELQFNTSSTPVNKIYTDDTYSTNALTISADTGVTLKSTNNYLLLDDTGTNEMVLNVDGGERMRVTSTGIDVTGTATMDGLTVDGDVSLSEASPTITFTDTTDSSQHLVQSINSTFNIQGQSVVRLSTAATKRFDIDNGGDISFYNTAGTSQALFWDASAEKLGIGTTSPTAPLAIKSSSVSSSTSGMLIQANGNTNNIIAMGEKSTDGGRFHMYDGGVEKIAFYTDGTANHISAGNVGIGTDSPQHEIDLTKTLTTIGQNPTLQVKNSWSGEGNNSGFDNKAIGLFSAGADTVITKIQSRFDSGANVGQIGTETNHDFLFTTNNTEKMRIDSSGNIGIGTSSPQNNTNRTTLTLSNSTSGGIFEIFGASDTRQLLIYNDTGESRFETLSGGSEDIVFRPNGSESVRFDSSGNVGIGTDSPSDELTIRGAQFATTTISIGDNSDRFRIGYLHASGLSGGLAAAQLGSDAYSDLSIAAPSNAASEIKFFTNASSGTPQQRATIDSSGNLLVGKSVASIGTVGCELRNDGYILGVNDGDAPLFLNRLSSDGDIAKFYKDGTTVGSIGAVAGDMFLGTASTGVRFLDANNEIIPITVSSGGGSTDGTISLGGSAYRFKDLYLSGQSLVQSGATTAPSFAFTNDPDTGMSRPTSDAINFCTAGSERVRIDSSGNVLFGKTSSSEGSDGTIIYGNTNSGITSSYSNPAVNTYHVYRTGATDAGYKFYVGFGGQIHSTSTSISGLSDVRLKENIVDLETGLDEVMALKPRRFDWKANDNKNIAGFIAQEVETVLPDLIGNFEHDDLDDAKSVKMGDMIPTLVKAIQEQQTQIEALQSEINLLKGE